MTSFLEVYDLWVVINGIKNLVFNIITFSIISVILNSFKYDEYLFQDQDSCYTVLIIWFSQNYQVFQ